MVLQLAVNQRVEGSSPPGAAPVSRRYSEVFSYQTGYSVKERFIIEISPKGHRNYEKYVPVCI